MRYKLVPLAAGSALLLAVAWVAGSGLLGDYGEVAGAVAPRGEVGATKARADVPLRSPDVPASGRPAEASAEAWRTEVAPRVEAEEPEASTPASGAAIEVITLDAGGASLDGVPIVLRRRRSTWWHDEGRRLTSSGGRASFPDIGAWLSEHADETWSVAVAARLAVPLEVALDPDALPEGPIVLRLPPLGSLEILVHELPGGPPLAGGRVELSVHDEDRVAAPSFWARPDSLSADLADGRALFTHVELGLDLDLEVIAESSTVPTRLSGPGPTASGQLARLEVTLGADHPVVRLRLLDTEGVPLASTALNARLEVGNALFSRNTFEESLATDAQGVLWYDLSPFWEPGGGRELTLRPDEAEAAGNPPGGSATLDLARELPPGLTDLGDVRFRGAVLLAAGSVLSAAGSPVAEAEVSLTKFEDWGGERRVDSVLDEPRALTGADGRFELRGELDDETLRVGATEGERSSELVECRRGESGVVLRLIEGGSVRGRLLLDEGAQADALRIAVQPAQPSTSRANVKRGGSVDAEGAFEIRGLLPGPYALRVSTSQGDDAIVELGEVAVVSGEASRDPRLDPIDLRGRLVCFRLELVPPKPSDTILGTASIRLRGAAQGEPDTRTRFLHGATSTLCFPAASVDVDIQVQGFRSVHMEDVRGDTRVELEPGLRVRLRLAGDAPLPAPPSFLKAFLSSDPDAASSTGHFQQEVVDSRREIAVVAPAAGTLYVHWLLEIRSENSMTTTGLDEEDLTTLDILDVAGEQVFEVPFPEQALKLRLEGNARQR